MSLKCPICNVCACRVSADASCQVTELRVTFSTRFTPSSQFSSLWNSPVKSVAALTGNITNTSLHSLKVNCVDFFHDLQEIKKESWLVTREHYPHQIAMTSILMETLYSLLGIMTMRFNAINLPTPFKVHKLTIIWWEIPKLFFVLSEPETSWVITWRLTCFDIAKSLSSPFTNCS